MYNKLSKQKTYTHINITADTYNKIHFLKQPFETHDECLNRVLTDYKVMATRNAMLEDMLIQK